MSPGMLDGRICFGSASPASDQAIRLIIRRVDGVLQGRFSE